MPDPLDPPIALTVTRPKVGYPTALFADAPNAEDRLLADAQRIVDDGVGDAPGIPDPDAETAEISVAVVGLRFDSANDGNGVPPVRTIYTTTREFPDDTDEPLVLALDWVDVADVTTLVAPAAGSIPLPRSREVIITVRAVGRSDPGLDYFGSESARFGDPTSVQMFAAGLDETGFFVADDPARQLRCVLLRPQEKETLALLARLRASGRGTEADTSPLHLLAEELGLETSGPALWAEPGRRVIFACSRDLAHVLSPDGSAVTFSSEADITDRWISVLTVGIQRDWTWNGDDRAAVEISRDGSGVIGRIKLPRSVNPEVFQAPEIAGAPVDRAATYLVFMDIIDPKPVPPAHPSEMSLSYTVTPVFRHPPEDTDGPLTCNINLPIAAPPTQTPRLVSAGVALSPYERDDLYSTTEVRTRLLWLEFEAAPENPADAYFGRVLSYAPDPMLTREAPVSPGPEPPLPIAPEFIRVDPARTVRRSCRPRGDAAVAADEFAAALSVAAAAWRRADEPRSPGLLRLRVPTRSLPRLVDCACAIRSAAPRHRCAASRTAAQLRSLSNGQRRRCVGAVCDAGVRRSLTAADHACDEHLGSALCAGHTGRRRGPSQHPAVAASGAIPPQARSRAAVSAERRRALVSVRNRGCVGVAWAAEIKCTQRACRGDAAGNQRRAGSSRRRSWIDKSAEVVATRAGAAGVRPAAVSRVSTGPRRVSVTPDGQSEELQVRTVSCAPRQSSETIAPAIRRRVRPVASASSIVSAPDVRPRTKKFNRPCPVAASSNTSPTSVACAAFSTKFRSRAVAAGTRRRGRTRRPPRSASAAAPGADPIPGSSRSPASASRRRSASSTRDGRRRSRPGGGPADVRARHDVGRAVREPHAGLRQRDLHHVLREVAHAVPHVLPDGGDAAQRGVVVGAEVRAATTRPSPAATSGRSADVPSAREDRLRRLDHQLEPQRAGAELEPALERVARARHGVDVCRRHQLRNGDDEVRRQSLVAARRATSVRDEEIERAQAARVQLLSTAA